MSQHAVTQTEHYALEAFDQPAPARRIAIETTQNQDGVIVVQLLFPFL